MIQVKNLSYSYNRDVALRFPDFTLQRGEHCLLLGESGSGKTTLLHIVSGLLRNYSGSVIIENTELASLSETALDKFRGRNIGFIFQRNHLIQALTVEKNLLMAPYLADVHVQEAQMQTVLTELALETKRKSKVTELSQGQAQRVAIARALLNNPPLIIADEPTSALDDKNCERVITLLLEVANRHSATLLIATHDQRLKDKIQNQIVLQA